MKLIYILALFIFCTAQTCRPNYTPPPSWSGKLWKADGEAASIRWKNPETNTFDEIFTNTPEFDEFVCMTIEDYVKIVKIIDSCKEWEAYITQKSTMRKLRNCFNGRR